MKSWRAVLVIVLFLTQLSTATAAQSPRSEVASAAKVVASDLDAWFTAARTGDLATVKRQIAAGLAIDTANRYGSTALALAAGNGRLDVVRFLAEKGADLNRVDNFYGARPLEQALMGSHRKVARLLLKRGAGPRESALGFALAQADAELAGWAVDGGPILASQLEAMRARADQLPDALRQALARAESRPDPPPPELTTEQSRRYTGLFEGWNSAGEVAVELVESQLVLTLPEGQPTALTLVGEDHFTGPKGKLIARFFGRAGSIEGINLTADGRPPESMRRSVAEPVASALGRIAQRQSKASTQQAKKAAPTVNWPSFRGTNAAGSGDGLETPVTWNTEEGEGVLWKAPIDGLGHSSPVVWGDTVFLTTAVAEGVEQKIRTGLTGDGTGVTEAVEHSWQVLAFHKWTGEVRWRSKVATGVPLTRRHFKATQANSTPATNGKYVVAIFPTGGLVCLDMAGKLLWKHQLGGLNAGSFYDPKDEWGYASSPILFASSVIAQVDVHGGAYLAAWDLATGKQLWRTEREVAPSWATPSLFKGPNGPELVVNGSTIHGYDPATGKQLWSLGPNSELVIATPVVGDGVIYVSAGYPPVKPIYAVRAGIRGDHQVKPGSDHAQLLWSHNRGGAYMPTPLLYRGLFYLLHHNGRLVAYDPATGEAIYKVRFSQGGTFTGSPIAANGKLYLPTEEGLLYVLQAGTDHQELAVNDFNEPLMATPAVSEGLLLVRTPTQLWALGKRNAGDDGGPEGSR